LPLLLIQHMPPGFTKAFAARLNELSSLTVREARDGDALLPGEALVAPAGLQTAVAGEPGRLFARVGNRPDSFFRPSADLSFGSMAEACGRRAIGAVLTGMGQDGARGLLALRQAGACTLAEAAETCVVHGMPRAAAEMGAARWILPLWDFPAAIMALVGRRDRTAAADARTDQPS
ncbi:MAG: CheB methylesterase domain-containing protein, partial [Bacteroidota bacterium]